MVRPVSLEPSSPTLTSSSSPALSQASSLSASCNAPKHHYDTCFNHWLKSYLVLVAPPLTNPADTPAGTKERERRNKQIDDKKRELEDTCGEAYKAYQSCLKVRPLFSRSAVTDLTGCSSLTDAPSRRRLRSEASTACLSCSTARAKRSRSTAGAVSRSRPRTTCDRERRSSVVDEEEGRSRRRGQAPVELDQDMDHGSAPVVRNRLALAALIHSRDLQPPVPRPSRVASARRAASSAVLVPALDRVLRASRHPARAFYETGAGSTTK